MTSKGQITVPKEIRDSLHLKKGDRVSISLERSGAAVLRPESLDILDLYQSVSTRVKGVSIESMKRATRRAASRR